MTADLTPHALCGLRRARDEMGWSDELRACAFAVGWLMRGGTDAKHADRVAAKVWADHFYVAGPF